MRIIDLLCLISNGEEVPKKIKYDNKIYEIVNKAYPYMYKDCNGFELEDNITKYVYNSLNDEVEILDDEEDKDIPLIPDDEIHFINMNDEIVEFKIDYNFKVLKEKLNQLVEEFNEYRKENKENEKQKEKKQRNGI